MLIGSVLCGAPPLLTQRDGVCIKSLVMSCWYCSYVEDIWTFPFNLLVYNALSPLKKPKQTTAFLDFEKGHSTIPTTYVILCIMQLFFDVNNVTRIIPYKNKPRFYELL